VRELYLTRHTAQYYSVGTQNILYRLGDTTNSVRIYTENPVACVLRQIEFRATAAVITIIISCASRGKGDKRIRRAETLRRDVDKFDWILIGKARASVSK